MKVIKFKDFTTNEDTYKINAEGKPEKQEWELYKDWHPAKFKVFNLTKKGDTTPFDDGSGNFVWVIKRNEKIVSIFSSEIKETKIEEFFENLKNNSELITSHGKDENL